jgi:hypothetical protein
MSHFFTVDGHIIISDPASPSNLLIQSQQGEKSFQPHESDGGWFIVELGLGYDDERYIITAGGADKMIKIWNMDAQIISPKGSFRASKKITCIRHI